MGTGQPLDDYASFLKWIVVCDDLGRILMTSRHQQIYIGSRRPIENSFMTMNVAKTTLFFVKNLSWYVRDSLYSMREDKESLYQLSSILPPSTPAHKDIVK